MGVLLGCRQNHFISLSSSHIDRVLVLGSGFLLSVADSPPTKILYRTRMVKAIFLPRVDRVVRHLDETTIGIRKSVIREGQARKGLPCGADGSQEHHVSALSSS